MNIIFEMLWVIVVAIGIICSIIIGLKYVYKYIVKKLKIKSVRKSKVRVVVKGKYYSPGSGPKVPRVGVSIESDSYRLEVVYNEQLYVLHNKQVFESVNTGDTFEMNLVEEVDKNENIIDSYLEVISTKYKQKVYTNRYSN